MIHCCLCNCRYACEIAFASLTFLSSTRFVAAAIIALIDADRYDPYRPFSGNGRKFAGERISPASMLARRSFDRNRNRLSGTSSALLIHSLRDVVIPRNPIPT